jgi:hypothetical protein
MIRKLLNIFEFFKTTLVINLAVCSIAVLLGGFDYFFTMFLSFGFLMSICFKEFYRKSDYLFYSNNGISKIQLWVSSYVLTFCVTVLIGMMIFLIKKLF